jgi:hypothetical protein
MEQPPTGSPFIARFEVGSFAIVRQFVEHIMDKNAPTQAENGERTRLAIDWEAVEVAVADSRTLEQAVGRAVVIADQTSRGLSDEYQLPEAAPWPKFVDPFFAFSLSDVLPDFGDGSRYRSKVRRKVAKIFGARRTMIGAPVVDHEEGQHASSVVGHDGQTIPA